jgi:hypothetical protein
VQGNQLNAIWGSGPNDIWAAGRAIQTTQPNATTMLHWNGSSWTTAGLPPGYGITGIWGSGPGDAWAVGANASGFGQMLHWNGTAWSDVSSSFPAGGSFASIWGAAANDVWVTGGNKIAHWDGTALSTKFTALYSGAGYSALWGSGPNDVWAVGTNGNSGGFPPDQTIMHWNGTAWTPATGIPSGLTQLTLNGVWGSSATDVWAVGQYTYYDASKGGRVWAGTTLHWNGTTWSNANNLTQAQLTGVLLDSVWGSSPNDVWAYGSAFGNCNGGCSPTGGSFLHWDGTAWTLTATKASVLALWGSSASDVWGVGPGGDTAHWTGSAWNMVSYDATGDHEQLNAIWGSGPNDVWVAGGALGYPANTSLLMHWDGQAWTRVSTGVAYPLYALWGTAANDVYAVGGGGTILHWDGTAWSGPYFLPQNYNLLSIWGSGPTDVWAVGDNNGSSIVLHGAGPGSWGAYPVGMAPKALLTVWGTAANDVWAVGSGQAVRWDGTSWTAWAGGGTGLWGSSATDVWTYGAHWNGSQWASVAGAAGTSIWGSAANDVWSVTDVWSDTGATDTSLPGVMSRWDGLTWSPVQTGANILLRAVWGTGPHDVWGVGSNGTILHHQ